MQQIFHLEGRQVQQVFRSLLAGADEGPREFGGHDLDYQSDPESEHLEEQLWLGSDEHGQVHQKLLSEHGRGLVVTVRLVYERPELVLGQRRDYRVLVGRWHAHSHLLLAYQQIGHRLGEILDPLSQHSGRVTNYAPHLLLTGLLVETLEEVLHQNRVTVLRHTRIELQAMSVNLRNKLDRYRQ